MVIKEKTYFLVGVIDCTIDQASKKDHYIAYCRTITGNWQMRDNEKRKMQIVKISPLLKNISLIIYLLCDYDNIQKKV